jgi:hypothetical protein
MILILFGVNHGFNIPVLVLFSYIYEFHEIPKGLTLIIYISGAMNHFDTSSGVVDMKAYFRGLLSKPSRYKPLYQIFPYLMCHKYNTNKYSKGKPHEEDKPKE